MSQDEKTKPENGKHAAQPLGDGEIEGAEKPREKGPAKREKKKRVGSQKKEKPEEKPKKPSFFAEVVQEMRRTTWPSKAEVLKWGLVVLAALLFFTIFTTIADNFIVTPAMYAVSGFEMSDGEFGLLPILLTIILFVSGILLLITIMMHSGDGGGLSDTAATSIVGGANSTAVVERNLDRITIILAIVFVATIILMMIFFPQGTIGQ